MHSTIVTGLLAWTSLAAAGGPPLALEPVATFGDPLFVTHAPGDFERIFVVEGAGRIQVVDLETGAASLFLDLEEQVDDFSEGGLLGLAFHPEYADNGAFFVSYTSAPDFVSTISRFQVSADPNVANAASEEILLTLAQPASNHNAGWIGFGPHDGLLYIAFGDGGANSSTPQDLTSLLGAILRIDVDAEDGAPYAIPAGNPFDDGAGPNRDELWHVGLRNPYRCDLDPATGDLWIADVGQTQREEVDLAPAGTGGLNFGWPCMEGTLCTSLGICTCNDPDLTLPIHEYDHGLGCAIIGGPVYRGCAMPELAGVYFFSDFCSGRIWTLDPNAGVTEITGDLDPDGVTRFARGWGRDAYGEIYICSGTVYRVVPEAALLAERDCNANGIADACELLDGSATDANGNGVLDECETACAGDVDGDGSVNLLDLNLILERFGTDDPQADVDGSGVVDSGDLNVVLADWGGDC